MFLIKNIFLELGLYPTPTVIATGRNCRCELGGCRSTLVLHLAEESVMEFEALLPQRRTVAVTDETTLQSDWTGLLFLCLRYFFPHLFSTSYFLPLSHCLIPILLFPFAGVWENTRA